MAASQMKSSVRSTSELAAALGISRWTVSRALNGHPGISPETVRRIREAARRHGFAPSVLGRGLRSGKTTIIGICLPDLVDYFLTNKITRLQEAIEARGFHPVMQMTNASEEREVAALGNFSAMHCAGVISIASKLKPNDPTLRGLAAAEIPVVKIDPLHSGHHGVVASDRVFAMREALAYLHGLGHRKLVTIGINSDTAYGQQRVTGLQAACAKLGWNFKSDVLLLNTPHLENDFDAGAALGREYLRLPARRARAILALNDRMALGAMRELQVKGVAIPQQVSVIGYDNAEFSAYAATPLTSIDPQVSELIDAAVEMLLAQGGQRRVLTAKSILIKPQLVVRESTGR